MAEVLRHVPGGYRFLKGVFPYSGGVAAEPGFAIERARFPSPVSLLDGFRRIAEHLQSAGRPLAAFCACELRSPEPFSEEGFREFNRTYGAVLKEWSLFVDGINPVARSNVCPELDPPKEPGFHAFSYTVPAAAGSRPGFVIAGCGEVPEGKGNYRDHIVRRGDVSPEGLREKARWVLAEQERRMAALGAGWADVTATQLYTIFDPHPFLGEELVRRGAMRGGLTWHYCRPPVLEIDFEMDSRGVGRELVL
jgi:hypothetical protein